MKEPVIIASVPGADYARLGHQVAEARHLISSSGLPTELRRSLQPNIQAPSEERAVH